MNHLLQYYHIAPFVHDVAFVERRPSALVALLVYEPNPLATA